MFQGQLVIDDPLAAFRGRFTILAPQMNPAGYFAGIRYGLENESARLNLNTILLADSYEENGAQKLLLSLPGMTEPIADAILDWIDPDVDQRTLGAEQEYYSSLSPPYAPRNGPLGSIEELLLVRDVTPALLFGADLNRNGLIEASEQPYTTIEGVDNTGGLLNRGWAAYLTLDSAEKNTRADGTPKIDINMQDLQELHTQALQVLDEGMANFIVVFRQGGAFDGDQTGQKVSAAGLTLDYDLPGRERLQSLLDLVGVTTQIVQQGNNGPSPTVDSPFADESSAMRDYLPMLFDNFAVNAAPSIPGRLNINQAPRVLLLGIPGLTSDAVEQIISIRLPEANGQRPDQAYEVWPLTSGIVDLETMKRLMPLVTAGGNVYRAQVVGYFDEEGPAYRIEAVVDATGTSPFVKRRRDLVEQGPGYTLDVLGTAVDDGP
jgi:DNA uptake protein ComE-like DNA-binding protein